MSVKLIVFVVDVVLSHVYSSSGLARRLQERGFAVEYWGDAKIRQAVEQQGFTFRSLVGLWPRYPEAIRLPTHIHGLELLFHPAIIIRIIRERRKWRKLLPESLAQFDKSLDALLSSHRPDLVVFDPFVLAYYPFFHRRRIPAVVLSSKAIPTSDPMVPPYDSYLVPSKIWCGRWLSRFLWWRCYLRELGRRALRAAARVIAAYTREDLLFVASDLCEFPLRDQIVRRWIEPDLHLKCVQEWALWIPGIDLPRERSLPANTRYVGPSVDLKRRELSVHLARRPASRYLVYVSVGTVRFRWRENVPFLRRVIEAFRDRPEFDVVISSGDEQTTRVLGVPPDGIRVFDFLPQLAMLDVADLVITHAGSGTFRECICKEVPMLAYPRNHDQAGNSARIIYHGIGLRGRRAWDSRSTIRRKALRALTDATIRQNLGELKAAIERDEDSLLNNALNSILNANMQNSRAGRYR